MHNSGASCRGNAEVYLRVIARSQRVARNARPMTGSATKQSTLPSVLLHGLLRFARNDGLV